MHFWEFHVKNGAKFITEPAPVLGESGYLYIYHISSTIRENQEFFMKYFVLLLMTYNLYADKLKDFEEVKKVFEMACIQCHSSMNSSVNGNFNMETYVDMLKGGSTWGPAIKPGSSQDSPLYLLTTLPSGSRAESKIMPPDPSVALSKKNQQLIKKWIDSGAYWPKGVRLKYQPLDLEIIKPTDLYKNLFVKKKPKALAFKNYTSLIPGMKVKYSMVAIPGGTFWRGSNDVENAQPVRKISVDSFWMGKYEATWEEYESFLFEMHQEIGVEKKQLSPIVSRPTPAYVDMTFGMGKKKRPAICLTQLAAKAYCMWLSAKTGHFYRLPTEAEWEYACRAGTATKYYWGDDLKDYKNYEWFYENSGEMYQAIGKKSPNPFGLYDMLGNVSEWCLDSYKKDFYKKSPHENPVALPISGGRLNDALDAQWPNKLYGRVVRGGSYNDQSKYVSMAMRTLSVKEWKAQDPQFPKSVWWMTDSLYVGFRIVRSKVIPPLKELHKYWPTDEEVKAVPKK